jgi:hypothetical protein
MSRNMLTATGQAQRTRYATPVHFITGDFRRINKALKKHFRLVVSGVDFKQPIRRRSCKQFEPIRVLTSPAPMAAW